MRAGEQAEFRMSGVWAYTHREGAPCEGVAIVATMDGYSSAQSPGELNQPSRALASGSDSNRHPHLSVVAGMRGPT